MKVTVTAENIRLGVPGQGERCPIALALKDRGIGGYVGFQFVTTDRGFKYRTSAAAKKFIDAFDKRDKVKPSTFELRTCK